MPAATPSVVREQERPAEAQPSAMPDEQAEQNEKSDEQQSQKEAGEQDRATPPREMPEAAYTFLNETGLAIGMLVFFRWLPWEFFPGANRSGGLCRVLCWVFSSLFRQGRAAGNLSMRCTEIVLNA